MLQTKNPLFTNEKVLDYTHIEPESDRMTITGTLNKTLLLLLVTIASGSLVWKKLVGTLTEANLWYFGTPATAAVVVALILARVTHLYPQAAVWTVWPYAILEGGVLGLLSGAIEHMYPGLVRLAMIATACGALAVLLIYYTGIIRPRGGVYLVFACLMLAVCCLQLICLFFIPVARTFMHGTGPLAVGLSILCTVLAGFSLLVSMDRVEQYVDKQAPKYIEWYSAFAVLVSLLWMYLEVLNLLMKLRERKKGS